MHDEPRKYSKKKIASFADAARFHGHTCPGLMPGYRAAKAALRELATERNVDESSSPSWRTTRRD